MTHAEARELLELAAAEPNGLERLAAGDTADSGALAGHLAGCGACREEYGRLERTGRLLRANLSTLPPPELRERTLARVAAEGRSRSPEPLVAAGRPAETVRPNRRLALGWLGSIAAAVALAVGLGWAVVARPLADEAGRNRDSTNALAHLTAATVALETRSDARRVALGSASGTAGAMGALTFSPSTHELVVVSTGLSKPAAGAEYRCWVEANGRHTQLGDMYFVGGIAAWEGATDAVADVPVGATFGVSLIANPGSNEAVPVLTGTLRGS